MDLVDSLALGFATALTPENLFYCFVGVLLGTLVGVLPGIGPTATIAMLLPVTFNFEPVTALIMLAGIYYGAQYGGSTTAILINLPGESSSAVTAIDGHEMARGGRAGAALATAALGSFFGGDRRHLRRRAVRARARERRARLRVRRVLLARGPGSDRLDRAGARVDAERPGDDRAGTPVRHGRTGHLYGHAALHLRCPGVVLRDQLRVGRGRHLRHRRDPAQPRGRCDALRRDQDRQEPVADAEGRPQHPGSRPPWHGPGRDAGRPSGRRSRPGVVRLVLRREADLQASGDIRTRGDRGRRRPRISQQCRGSDLLHPAAHAGPPGAPRHGAHARRLHHPRHHPGAQRDQG